MAAEQCPYCGRFMALVDYGAEHGTELVCSKQRQHALSDPEHWTVPELDALGCRWQRPEGGHEHEGYSFWVHNAPWGECLNSAPADVEVRSHDA